MAQTTNGMKAKTLTVPSRVMALVMLNFQHFTVIVPYLYALKSLAIHLGNRSRRTGHSIGSNRQYCTRLLLTWLEGRR